MKLLFNSRFYSKEFVKSTVSKLNLQCSAGVTSNFWYPNGNNNWSQWPEAMLKMIVAGFTPCGSEIIPALLIVPHPGDGQDELLSTGAARRVFTAGVLCKEGPPREWPQNHTSIYEQ